MEPSQEPIDAWSLVQPASENDADIVTLSSASAEVLDTLPVKLACPCIGPYEVRPLSPTNVTDKSPSPAFTLGITKTDAIKAKVATKAPYLFIFCSIFSPFFRPITPLTIGTR